MKGQGQESLLHKPAQTKNPDAQDRDQFGLLFEVMRLNKPSRR